MKKRILVINGPNLNLLGKREPEIYGKLILKEIQKKVSDFARQKGVEMEWFQSNSEGEIVDKLQVAQASFDGVIINPAALSHTSYSILDALKALKLPCIEVHLSNIFSRESFRRQSVTASGCLGMVSGLGWEGYLYAVLHLTGESK